MVENYFNIESIGVKVAPLIESDNDIRAKRILHETTKRVGNRFQTGLLWKSDNVVLPNSYQMALNRLNGIEKKMQRDEEFYAAYSGVINDIHKQKNTFVKSRLRSYTTSEIKNGIYRTLV